MYELIYFGCVMFLAIVTPGFILFALLVLNGIRENKLMEKNRQARLIKNEIYWRNQLENLTQRSQTEQLDRLSA